MNSNSILRGAFLLFAILFLSSVSAYMSSNPQTTQFNLNPLSTEKTVCQQGQDFIIQISPFGCTPAVVRSDLLQESDVSVYCQLGATKINPLIDVEAIDSISFSGQLSKYVSGVGFHPAKAALGVKEDLNTPVLSNIGYVVVNLKKQTNVSAIPDYVSGNLTAKIKYNIKNAFGIGSALFYLPEFATETDFQAGKYQYSFWNGKGYLKADNIGSDDADISVYTDTGKLSTVNLKKGETSQSIYLPGFECEAGLKLKLESLASADTRAKLKINAEIVEVSQDEKFLDNKCSVSSLRKNGLSQQVNLKCQEDDGTNSFSLIISPKVKLKINQQEKEAELGQKLYESSGKSVYLAYIGTAEDTTETDDLFIYLVAMPSSKENLSTDELSSISSLIKLLNAQPASLGVISVTSTVIKSSAGAIALLSRMIADGEEIFPLMKKDGTANAFGSAVSIVGFAGVQNIEFTGSKEKYEAGEYYENAKKDYDTIIESYSYEAYGDSSTYGEEALYNEIALASDANQGLTARDLCDKFAQSYPNSKKNTDKYCSNYKLSNSESGSVYVTINKQVKQISFEGIYEPSFEDYGVVLIVKTPDGMREFDLRKNQIIYFSETGSDYLQLISADDNSARIKTNLKAAGLTDSVIKQFGGDTIKLEKNVQADLNSDYSFTLTDIKLKKFAKVSLIPNINNAGTTANFSFKIGVEKTAIELPPEKVKQMITNLDKEINQWKNLSTVLGNVTQTLKTSCIVTGAALIVKNFLLNAGGEGIARQYVMRGTNGWFEKCKIISAQTGVSVDKCLTDKADKIDASVAELSKLIGQQNSRIKQLEDSSVTSDILGNKVIDTDKYMASDIPVVNTYLKSNLPAVITDPSGKGAAIDTNNLLNNILTSEGYSNNRLYTSEQLNEIELWTMALNSANADLKETAQTRLYSVLRDVQANAEDYLKITQLANNLGINPDKINALTTDEKTKVLTYNGLKNRDLGSRKISGISDDEPVAIVQTLPDGNQYTVVLDDKGMSELTIKQLIPGTTTSGESATSVSTELDVTLTLSGLAIYDSSGKLVTNPEVIQQFQKVYFKRYNAASYNNQYKNAKLAYYETEPYKGMPAIVPFDLTNGWYASMKQTLSLGSIQTYETSGRVSSFYLCNVGENGLEENMGGDDICEMINTGTGQAYNLFPGLEESEAKTLINKAVQAIEQASKIPESQRKGTVSINGQNVQVGSPAADIPEFQCQDFMSPKECLLLFNLCDPVICPSSRCNLGGAYPVKDVVQSGVIGSLVLCLPNIQEGIVMPVCLTGVVAGINGLISVQKSYRDCLQESLDTGKLVGICDEIYSLYLCDFFWRQALPFADLVIPKIVELLLGQNVRGGGEYLTVSNAWSATEKAINYFVNSYGVNSKEAFLTRTTEGIGGEICKLYTSAVYPSGADLLNTLTEPDSPPQFTGRFDEITLTTATVPPTSQYKVYYHIYAGKDSGAYYKVYLEGSPESSYYKDTAQTVMVDSGYVAVDSYVSEAKDIIATSGYKKLCINVNGQEECGFTITSTDFGLNYLSDLYVSIKANQTSITSETECISDYNLGIIRICATDNPGKGTDAYAGTENSRWKDVGYCDNTKIRCWIDTESIQDAIRATTIENATIGSLSANYLNILLNQSGYLTEEEFSSAVLEIEDKEAMDRITSINNIFEKVFLSNEKVQLLYIRGNAYAELFRTLWSRIKPEEKKITTPSGVTSTTTTVEGEQIEVNIGYKIWETAKAFAGSGWDEYRITNNVKDYDNVCTRFIDRVMIKAGVTTSAIKSGIDFSTSNVWYNIENMDNLIPIFEKSGDFAEITDFSKMLKGDIVMLGYVKTDGTKENTQHIVIFDSYTSNERKYIKVYGDQGQGTGVLGKYSIPVMLETGFGGYGGYTITAPHTPPKSGDWYVYRVFRYVADLSPEEKAGTATPAEETPAETTEETGTGISATKADKIWQAAAIIISEGSTDSAARFVSRSLINAGVAGILQSQGTISSYIPSSASSLVSILEKDSDFTEVDVKHLERGDVILIGHECEEPYSVGIFDYLTDDAKTISLFTNLKDKVKIESLSFITDIQSDREGLLATKTKLYFYRAYRYTADLGAVDKADVQEARERWTLEDAITHITSLKGNYESNKKFIDELVFDGILNKKECEDVRAYGWNLFGGKDMNYIRKLLIAKCASSDKCSKFLTK
jgi:hypothetical protein